MRNRVPLCARRPFCGMSCSRWGRRDTFSRQGDMTCTRPWYSHDQHEGQNPTWRGRTVPCRMRLSVPNVPHGRYGRSGTLAFRAVFHGNPIFRVHRMPRPCGTPCTGAIAQPCQIERGIWCIHLRTWRALQSLFRA